MEGHESCQEPYAKCTKDFPDGSCQEQEGILGFRVPRLFRKIGNDGAKTGLANTINNKADAVEDETAAGFK